MTQQSTNAGEQKSFHLLLVNNRNHGGVCSSVLDPNPRGVGGGVRRGEGGGVENFSPFWGHSLSHSEHFENAQVE